MSRPYETIQGRICHAEIHQDVDPMNPNEWDDVGNVFFAHPELAGLSDCKEYAPADGALVIPIRAYIHGGATIRAGDTLDAMRYPFTDPWDSCTAGAAWIDPDEIANEWGAGPDARDKAEAYLRGRIETLDQYITGDVWGVVIKDDIDGEVVDSCWGFFGFDYAREEAAAMLAAADAESPGVVC